MVNFSEEKILKFITSVDFINKHKGDNFLLPNKKIEISISNIYTFLIQTFITKIKQQFESKIISEKNLLINF